MKVWIACILLILALVGIVFAALRLCRAEKRSGYLALAVICAAVALGMLVYLAQVAILLNAID